MTWNTLSSAMAIGAAAMSVSSAHAQDVRLMTLDPGHFHAALVQKSMIPGVDPKVHVYAAEGADLKLHMARIDGFNTRAEAPTTWQTEVHVSDDPLSAMLKEKPGNVVVLAGNNALKTERILASVKAGLNVLADKPMAINPQDLELLREAFAEAQKKGVLLYDIMTERHEVTIELQRELSRMPELYGTQMPGTPEQPAVTKESVHHLFKYVSGKPLQRPDWFFDETIQGEGLCDVGTHLVDLIQWECFPEQILKTSDVEVLSARKWPTLISEDQFKKATALQGFTPALRAKLNAEGQLPYICNGEMIYTLKGVHCKVSVIWNFEAPQGAADTHYSLMQGSKCALILRQGAGQGYKPTLYIEPCAGEKLGAAVTDAVARLQAKWPGVKAKATDKGWVLEVPDHYKVGHEAHFAQVAEAYFGYLKAGKLPEWEVPNILVKHHTLMEAYRKSR
ncbi:MAG TPA: putative oxidoreductase C-terminal domain-containing protein [Luteolibacter sp.]|nr:putative oxidoreductase C-terminal domain-containing protein [Luteolibacter sp.]